MITISELKRSNVNWDTTPDNPYVFQAELNGKVIYLRLNDFPDEPLCTVIIDGAETDLHEFPTSWTIPRHRERTPTRGN
jgi:hypothetical protein